MKIAIVIPTLNAVSGGKWQEVLDSVAAQNCGIDRKIILDSSSEDATCVLASAAGWECRSIPRGSFNHGATRNAIARQLADEGIDTVVFLTQDVILQNTDAVARLTSYLWQNPVAGCYGRQISRAAHTLDAWQRSQCYPAGSSVKTKQDAAKCGIMAVFFSNAFAAWKTAEIIRYGGFPATDFGEDTLLAAAVLNQGGAIGYCAEAEALHEHANTFKGLFARGVQVGKFHRDHPELLKQFKATKNPAKAIPLSLWGALGVKAAGYLWGRTAGWLIPWLCFFLIWLLLIPAINAYDLPPKDIAGRYAPMAEAFAHGDWQFAFHPRVTPLLPIIAGIITAIFGCNGALACQLAASLFLTLGVFPLYFGCKKNYGFAAACTTTLLYALCPPLLRLGYYGFRETACIFSLLLLFYAVTRLHDDRRDIAGFALFAVAQAMLLTSRGDVAAFSIAASLALFIWDIWRNRIAWRSIAAGAVIIAMISPLLCRNYDMIGYPVPEFRHAIVLQSVVRQYPCLKWIENPHSKMMIRIRKQARHE